MPNCVLTAGIPLECVDSVAGVKNVYIAAYNESATSFTYDADDVIDTVTTSETFYTFKFRPQTASFVEDGTHSTENGTNFWTQTLTMIFHKMDADKRNQVLLLAGADLHVIVETQNGEYWLMGLKNGANLNASQSAAGKGYGDLNGYTLTIVGTEPKLAHEMSSTAFGTLTISA